jgi:PAS domain S-box-containing protein
MEHTEFVEHGYCLLWEPGLVRLHVLSDIITGLSYYAIAGALFFFCYKRRDLPFLKIFLLFGLFILACGTTHLAAAYTIYVPAYWSEGVIKGVTAFVSLISAIIFIPLMPRAIAMPSITKAMEELKESENKFKALFNSNTDGLIMADAVTRKFELVNERICEMLGYTVEELKSMGVEDIHAEIDLPRIIDQFNRFVSGDLASGEVPLKRKNGSIFYAEVNSSRITQGGKDYLLGSFRDITERKLSEDALRKSEVKYRRLLQSMVDGFVFVDMQGRIIEYNDPYRAMLGYTDQELASRTFIDITPEKWHEFERKVVGEQIIKRGYSDVYIKEYKRKDGTVFPVEIRSFLIKDELSNNVGMWGIIRDITDRMKADAAVLESEKRYHSLFQNSLNGLAVCRIILDIEGRPADFEYLDVNDAFELLTGLKNVIGKKVTEVIPGIKETNPELIETYGKVALSGQPETFEVFISPLGIWLSISVFSPEREIFVTVFDNITEKKRAEEDRRRLEEQLRQSQKMEAIGQLAGGVAHDFNNIINAIMGFCTLIQMKLKPDDPANEYANEIMAATDRAANLTRSLLAFGRKQIINIKPISLNDNVRAMSNLLANFLGEDLRLKMDLCEEDTVIMADAGQIDQILMNLVTNARDAMPKGGSLTISTRRFELDDEFVRMHGYGLPGKYAVMAVEDSGAGMEKETIEKIFEPFFTTKEPGKGTGLGLAIVYGIVKQHNGFIDVYSEPGHGTSFKIYLPAAELSAEQSISRDQTPLKGGKETILLVEDEKMLRSATKTMLEKLGYKVLEAVDGVEAVSQFEANMDMISITLMDVIMPNKNGLDAYQEIRAIRPDAKVIFISGYTRGETAREIQDEGLELLLKPVSVRELLDKIRKVIGDAN